MRARVRACVRACVRARARARVRVRVFELSWTKPPPHEWGGGLVGWKPSSRPVFVSIVFVSIKSHRSVKPTLDRSSPPQKSLLGWRLRRMDVTYSHVRRMDVTVSDGHVHETGGGEASTRRMDVTVSDGSLHPSHGRDCE